MKGKVLTRRTLTPQLTLPKFYLSQKGCQTKKYSQSFIDLMQKAMLQLKTKSKSKSQIQKSEDTFVWGLFPSVPRKTSTKYRSVPRKSFISINSQEIQLSKSPIPDRMEQSQNLNSPKAENTLRFKATFHIKARKSFRTEKKKYFQDTFVKQKQQKASDPQSPSKVDKESLMTEHHIEPWSINEQFELCNKLFL